MTEGSAYHELSAYTLELRDPEFLHQHVVDAYAAQHASESTKPIGITFALVGLYLHVEMGYTGKEVQRVHMSLAKKKRPWPVFVLPSDRGSVTAENVMRARPGPDRNAAIETWAASVWRAFHDNRQAIIALLTENQIIRRNTTA